MDKPLSDKLTGASFEPVRRGYDPIAVSNFLTKVSEQARLLEVELANVTARHTALERRLEDSATNKQQVSAAFVAAADAKQALLEDAQRQANRIMDRAKDQATRLAGPHEDVEQSRKEVAELMLQAKRRVAAAEAEAADIIAAAQEKAEAMTSQTRSDALNAVTESKLEAERLLAEADNEYRRISLMLRGLKSAVRDMIADGEDAHEDIRVVLAESETATRPVALD